MEKEAAERARLEAERLAEEAAKRAEEAERTGIPLEPIIAPEIELQQPAVVEESPLPVNEPLKDEPPVEETSARISMMTEDEAVAKISRTWKAFLVS
jgi:hypothetical protein